jgi:signal transduction histidine kinase
VEEFTCYITGKTDFDFFDRDRAQSAFDDEQEIMKTGKPLQGKVERAVLPDGKVYWALSTKMPWTDEEGRIIGTFGISKDITAIKETEAKLEGLHKQLVETSRQAGMAEVASSVLHNVGNVLNSVNVSTNLLMEKIQQSRLSGLSKVVSLIEEQAGDFAEFIMHDPRGKALPHYLVQLNEQLLNEHVNISEELQSLTRNVEHIKNIVATQQDYAKVSGVTECVQPSELIEDALRFNAGSLARHRIAIHRDFAPNLPILTIDKHKVIQILVNLIANAKHACDGLPRPDKLLSVSVRNGADRIRIAVSDNGVGIPPENLTRIFSLGFTTRPDGHGFGLHSGAVAAQELRGALRVHSDGPGKGATFTLELPVHPEASTSAAPTLANA